MDKELFDIAAPVLDYSEHQRTIDQIDAQSEVKEYVRRFVERLFYLSDPKKREWLRDDIKKALKNPAESQPKWIQHSLDKLSEEMREDRNAILEILETIQDHLRDTGMILDQ